MKVAAQFFMGASDNACDKKFFWCSGQVINVADFLWIRGQPNHFMGIQHCIAHINDLGGFLSSPDWGINDWSCSDSLQYLCE